MEVSFSEYDDLIKRYLDVCNQAMAENKDRFPFKQILGAARKSEIGKVIEVQIKGTGSDANYAMTLGENGLSAVPHSDCHSCRCDRGWSITKDYLEDVVRDPQSYIQNPALINWDWMLNVAAADA